MDQQWYQTRVSLEFALTYGCFAPKLNQIPYDDHALRDIAYGECRKSVQAELNLAPTQPGIAIYRRSEVHGIVHDVEQVGLMLTGWMQDGDIQHNVMRCMDDATWEVSISRNKPLEVENV